MFCVCGVVVCVCVVCVCGDALVCMSLCSVISMVYMYLWCVVCVLYVWCGGVWVCGVCVCVWCV